MTHADTFNTIIANRPYDVAQFIIIAIALCHGEVKTTCYGDEFDETWMEFHFPDGTDVTIKIEV